MAPTDSGPGAEATDAPAAAPLLAASSVGGTEGQGVSAEAWFRTASGKPMVCSSESIAHAAHVVACYAVEPTATAHMRVASSGRHVYIAPERLQAAEEAYVRLSQEEDAAGSDAEGVAPVGAHLTTGTGKLVHLSKESLAQAAEVVSCFSHEPPSRVHLMSGSGKKMKISPEAMDKACAVYARLSQSSTDTVGDEAGDAPAKKSDTLCLTTGAGKRITPCKRGYAGSALDPLQKTPAT